jgi:thioredoxin-related protein
LEYVADKHYKRENLRKYLSHGESVAGFEESELNESPIFAAGPHSLDRSRFSAGIPLVVFFEQPTCYACNVLHEGPLSDKKILKQLAELETVQLDMKSDTPVIRPDGKRTTARQWAEDLQLYYAPTILFFDETGKETLRIDSIVHFYRFDQVLQYILNKGYLNYDSFQLWRQGRK